MVVRAARTGRRHLRRPGGDLPEEVLQALVLVFGAFALVNGIMTVFTGLSTAPLLLTLVGAAAGGRRGSHLRIDGDLFARLHHARLDVSDRRLGALHWYFEIVVAIQFRRVLTGEWMLVLGGLLSIVFGGLLFVFPAAGVVSMTWLIGVYAILLGSSEMIFGFRLHSLEVRIRESH